MITTMIKLYNLVYNAWFYHCIYVINRSDISAVPTPDMVRLQFFIPQDSASQDPRYHKYNVHEFVLGSNEYLEQYSFPIFQILK